MGNKIYGNLENRVFDLNEPVENGTGNKPVKLNGEPEQGMTFDKFKTPFFAWMSGIILAVGFIYGIYAADHYPLKTVETVGTYSPIEKVVETQNYTLMWLIWGGALLLAFSFFTVFCILRNQDKIIEALKDNK